MTASKTCVLLVSAMLISGAAWAGGKKLNGLSFQLSPQPAAPCLFQSLYVRQEPDPFFKDLKEFKSKRGLQYRRGHDVVANFPDSTTIIVEISQGLSGVNACSEFSKFDPATVKFHVEWRSDSPPVPAEGQFVLAGKSLPQRWCEDKCVVCWTYVLTIDSQNVPLQDDLLLRIEAQDGTRFAEYTGKLGTEEPQLAPPFNLAIP